MNEELKRDTVTLNGTETSDNKIIIKTDKGFFSFFKEKKEGGISKAYETISEIKPQNKDSVVVMYKEKEYNGKTYKNAVMFYRPNENDYPEKQDDSVIKKIEELEKRIEALEKSANSSKEEIPTIQSDEMPDLDKVPF
jgi:vacuolar-type H+-ATPase subunit I/STV1